MKIRRRSLFKILSAGAAGLALGKLVPGSPVAQVPVPTTLPTFTLAEALATVTPTEITKQIVLSDKAMLMQSRLAGAALRWKHIDAAKKAMIEQQAVRPEHPGWDLIEPLTDRLVDGKIYIDYYPDYIAVTDKLIKLNLEDIRVGDKGNLGIQVSNGWASYRRIDRRPETATTLYLRMDSWVDSGEILNVDISPIVESMLTKSRFTMEYEPVMQNLQMDKLMTEWSKPFTFPKYAPLKIDGSE